MMVIEMPQAAEEHVSHIERWKMRGVRCRWRGERWTAWLLAIGVLACVACDVTGDAELPPDVQDPAAVHTPAGATGYYRGVAGVTLSRMLDPVIVTVGILTDEITSLPIGTGQTSSFTFVDSRQDLAIDVVSAPFRPYVRLHKLRAQAREARGFLSSYAPDSSPALTGHLYTMEGYAEIFLADLFCSGIPLSTVEFGGDYTFAPGSSTQEMYRHAMFLFDSAIARTSDSVRIQHLTALGRGRALLALAQYAEAAAAVAAVPDEFRYQVPAPAVNQARFSSLFSGSYALSVGRVTMADREGTNGLDYRSSGDPRTAAALLGTDPRGGQGWGPRKYQPFTAAMSFVLASGIEARLIEAEAALQAGDLTSWLGKLNQPRQNPATCGTIVPATACPLSMLEDPGAALTDPAAAMAARVNLLFRERAFWLYLTGQRQGDLRRLIRQYDRVPDSVYPTGAYTAGGAGIYGNHIVMPVPETETEWNPSYTGCFHINA